MSLLLYVLAATGFFAAAWLATLLVLRRRNLQIRQGDAVAAELRGELEASREAGIRQSEALEHLQGDIARREEAITRSTSEAQQLRERLETMGREHAVLQTRFDAAALEHARKLELLEETKAVLKTQFEQLAERVFEQKTKSFDAANKEQIRLLLMPFREQIDRFAKQSQSQYMEETKARHLLQNEIGRLKTLNERIAEDAINLTNALKGENKTQGNWGEIVLERVLESSGLRAGHEYESQGSYKDATGNLLRPDIVVFLPQERCVIIDSKVSLVAYEQFMNSDDPETKAAALRQHLASVHAHIKGLSSKRYEDLPGMRTLDFVLLFMPVEGAFHLALEHDGGFFKKAYDERIIVVSPSTLLATLRTIENIWRTERQQQNAEKIARQAEDLYDKFVGFVDDMQRIGEQIGRTNDSWEKAMNKLSQGKGNLIRRAEQMKSLGLSPKKQLPGIDDDEE